MNLSLAEVTVEHVETHGWVCVYDPVQFASLVYTWMTKILQDIIEQKLIRVIQYSKFQNKDCLRQVLGVKTACINSINEKDKH